MFKKSLSILLIFAVALAVATGESVGRKPANAPAEPRLLWFRQDSKQQQPIVIVQPSNHDSDRHYHRHPPPPPSWYDYYPNPTPPRRPFGASSPFDYGAIVIVNPNNAQNLTFPAAAAAAASDTGTGGRSSANRRASNPIVDLLQEGVLSDDTEVINAADNTEVDADAALSQLVPQAHYTAEERDEEDELSLLERQAARGLSPKHLISFLLQDKKRRRFQEAVAGIYLRNYNLNRK